MNIPKSGDIHAKSETESVREYTIVYYMKKATNGHILRFTYESVRFPKIGCDGVENCYNKILMKGKIG